jgi:hypothetical protein
MTVTELKTLLAGHPERSVRFRLPDGTRLPSHAHVTEVARIDKRFIDCGGTVRNESFCRLQTWHSDDVDHRLSAGKLARILEKSGTVLASDELEVDVEYDTGILTQSPLASVESSATELIFHLVARHTGCLAQDQCKPAPKAATLFDPLRFNPALSQPGARCCAGK